MAPVAIDEYTMDEYTETSKPNRVFVWVLSGLIVGIPASGMVWQFVQRSPSGVHPMTFVFFWALLWMVVWLLFSIRLTTSVSPSSVQIRYIPLWRRTIPTDQIAGCEPIKFLPLLDHGGWGIRWAPGSGWVYTVGGRTGVRVALRDGRRLVIGSPTPDLLTEAVLAVIADGANDQISAQD